MPTRMHKRLQSELPGLSCLVLNVLVTNSYELLIFPLFSKWLHPAVISIMHLFLIIVMCHKRTWTRALKNKWWSLYIFYWWKNNFRLGILFKWLMSVTGHIGIGRSIMFMWGCYNLLYSQLVKKIAVNLLMQLISQEEKNRCWNSNHFAISALFLLLTYCSYYDQNNLNYFFREYFTSQRNFYTYIIIINLIITYIFM